MQYFNLNKDFDDIDDYYEVEKIITRRNDGKNKLYLIKWLGFPIKDCTWEPISHLGNINNLVENFDKNFPNSKDKRLLRKYLHSRNKRNKQRFINRNKIKQKKILKNENNKNNDITIELEDSTISKINSDEIEKGDEKNIIVEKIEISEEKNKDKNISIESLSELTKDNSEPKLIKPIII